MTWTRFFTLSFWKIASFWESRSVVAVMLLFIGGQNERVGTAYYFVTSGFLRFKPPTKGVIMSFPFVHGGQYVFDDNS